MVRILGFLLLTILFSSCGTGGNHGRQKLSYNQLCKEDQGNLKYKGHYKVGDKYTINNKKYKPRKYRRYRKTGIASWYGERYGFHGNTTANGDLYNKDMLTAAHNTLQLPSLVKVTNLENSKTVIVMVNDRGPFAKNRIIDLSEKAADILEFKSKGTAKVRIEYLPKESAKLLKILGLKDQEHSTSRTSLKDKNCTVNCHLKLFNYKNKIQLPDR